MIQNNSNENVDPKKIITPDLSLENEEAEREDDEEGYDILPSNGSGLAGDDGEQVIDEGEEENDE